MKTYHSIISQINYISFLALLIALPYPFGMVRICWMIWVITWLLEFRFLYHENLRANSKQRWISIGIIAWLVLNCISVIWSPAPQASWLMIQRYASLLAIPFIYTYGVNTHYNTAVCLKVFAISAFVSIWIYIFSYYWIQNYAHTLDKYAPLVSVDWLHIDNLLCNSKHHIHFTNVLCMVISILLLYRKQLGRWLVIAGGILCLWAVYASGSRMGLINIGWIVITSLLVWFAHSPSWRRGIITGLTVLITLGAACYITLHHPRLEGQSWEEVSRLTDDSIQPAKEPRFAIWHTAVESPQDFLLHGLGAGQSTSYLVSHYQAHGWTYYAEHQYSAHNQYLGICIDLGLVVALLFFLGWCCIPFAYSGFARYWMVCVAGITGISMMTEMLMSGLEGISFFCAMSILAILLPNHSLSLQPNP